MGLRVAGEGESEGRPVIGRIGVEPQATFTHAKAGRLPSGDGAREKRANLFNRQSRCRRVAMTLLVRPVRAKRAIAAQAGKGHWRSNVQEQLRQRICSACCITAL